MAAGQVPAIGARALNVESPEFRAVLQVVGRRSDVTLLDEWGEKKPRTQIVAIGAPGSVDEDALKAAFESCIASP
ncbi:MAG TPA: GTP-binding protein [candidate division Zixibacteria bacterium]|nr:GTP-binding protein [candidate division Zixibacteria bacterium]